MCKNIDLKVDTSAIEKVCAEWATIMTSVSYAKRNGKVCNRILFVDRKNAENFIMDTIGWDKKITNIEFGKVSLEALDIQMPNEPASLQLIEKLSNGSIGRVLIFKPEIIEGVFVYNKSVDRNIFEEKTNKNVDKI